MANLKSAADAFFFFLLVRDVFINVCADTLGYLLLPLQAQRANEGYQETGICSVLPFV